MRDVGPDGTGDSAEVDAAVLVEALVLDRDDRLLERRADLVAPDEDPALRSAQRGEDRAAVVRIDVSVDLLRDAARVAARNLPRDGRHHPECERSEAEEEENQQDGDKTKLPNSAPHRPRRR